MKNILFSMLKLYLIFCYTIGFAQENKDEIICPITIIEDSPKFPNCGNETKINIEESKKCFFQEMNNHIKEHFNYPRIAQKKENTRKSYSEIYY